MSAERLECCNNETTNGDDAPSEIGAERSDFSTDHVRSDTLAVLGGPPTTEIREQTALVQV